MNQLMKIAYQLNSFKQENGKDWKRVLIKKAKANLEQDNVLVKFSKDFTDSLHLIDIAENTSDIALLLEKNQNFHQFRMNMLKGA